MIDMALNMLISLSLSFLIKQMEMTSLPALEVWSMERKYK